MPEKSKTQADKLLIKSIFSIDPVDWARYPDGYLSFISPTGQKFRYSNQQLLDFKKDIVDFKSAGKKAAAKKSAPKPKPKQKSTFKPKPPAASAK